MIEKIIRWSAKNRWIVLTVYLVACGYGFYSVSELPVDAIPDLSENQVIVYSEYMGRSPEVVENQITYPISTALQGLAEVKAVRAASMFGMSFVFIIFNDDVDIYFARTRVQEKLSTVQTDLPKGVIPKMGPDGTGVGHIYWYTLKSRNHDLGSLRSIQDWFVRRHLQSVEGVAEVASIGGFVKQYQVDVSAQKLQMFNLSIFDITSVIEKNNEVGGKLIEINDAEFFIRGQGYIRTLEEIENLPIITRSNGIPVLIKQVATVQIGGDIRRGILESNGEGETVGGIVVLRQGQNADKVINRVKEKIKEISVGLPEGVSIETSYDRTDLIQAAISTLKKTLLETAVVVSIVVALFLLHFRSIIRIIIEIPVSVLIAFILMKTFGISSNIMSLGGIILAIGVIVDASMVLVENAYRNIAKAQQAKPDLSEDEIEKISVDSAVQVGRAIYFSELIILVAFLPVFFLKGQEGKLFHPLVFTKTFTMIGSLVVVITLIPVLMTLLMKGNFRLEHENPLTRFFITIYEPILKWSLHHRKTILCLNLLALLATIPMSLKIGSEFMPPLDEGSILFMPVTLPTVSAPEIARILKRQDQVIKSIPEVSAVLGKAGKAETATDNAPLSMIETIILLKPQSEWRKGLTKKQIIAELDSKLQIPGVRNGWTQPIINRISMLATGIRTDVGLKIYGTNLDTLEKLAIEAETLLKSVDGAADVVAERTQGGNYLDLSPKQFELSRFGVSISDLQNFIETAIGGENLSKIVEGRERYPIRVRLERISREDIEEIKRIPFPVNPTNTNPISPKFSSSFSPPENSNSMGMNLSSTSPVSTANQISRTSSLNLSTVSLSPFVPLSELAEVILRKGPTMIQSENGQLRSAVLFNIRNRDLGSVVEDAKEIVSQNLKIPSGYSVSWSGQYEQKQHAERTLLLIIPVVLLIIFLLLYLTFKDFKESIIVMLSVPFALVGGVYMIFFLGFNFSVAVWVGFIALYGVAVETGVVMVLYLHESLDSKIQQYSKENIPIIDKAIILQATIEGSVLRLRPKLMTVITSMIGLIPIMWATGTGIDVMKPLAAPMIGGLLTSAVHVLLVTPILFVYTKEFALKKGLLTISKMSTKFD
ncbi:MAG: CusA/CzcA family heavy metal efflux RND transporter [Chloroherpetonaceae bacterium]|nr:CusA/CzcA family heavy metal efflux RND transporter [Chloroherpetonaceae bacterium]